MLSKDQCLKLKEWGLLPFGAQLYYCGGGLWRASEIHKHLDCVGIPDTKQLLEFANEKIQEKEGGDAWLQIQCPNPEEPKYYVNVGSIYGDGAIPQVADDPDIDQAIYKLLEKVMGEQK